MTSICAAVLQCRRKRMKLFLRLLGPFCNVCGSRDNLTVDVIQPAEYRCNRMRPSVASPQYRLELARGNMQILCGSCNSAKGHRSNTAWLAHEYIGGVQIVPHHHLSQREALLKR